MYQRRRSFRNHPLPVMAVLAVLTAALSSATRAQIADSTLVGCYRLLHSQWQPPINPSDHYRGSASLPAAFRLTRDIVPAGLGRGHYRVRPVSWADSTLHQYAWWELQARTHLVVVWSTGFAGIRLELNATDADTLYGEASTFVDYPATSSVASVTLTRASCSGQARSNTRMKLPGAFVLKEVIHLAGWWAPANGTDPTCRAGGSPAAYAQSR